MRERETCAGARNLPDDRSHRDLWIDRPGIGANVAQTRHTRGRSVRTPWEGGGSGWDRTVAAETMRAAARWRSDGSVASPPGQPGRVAAAVQAAPRDVLHGAGASVGEPGDGFPQSRDLLLERGDP